MTIAHVSDLHFGRIAHPGIVEALIEEMNGADIDLMVLSGDLTQRARPREFEAARSLLDAIDPPTLVVPGNHDVYPWWRPLRRLRTPLRRYKQAITDDLAPSFETDDVAVLGISTAHGATVKGGRITEGDRAAIRDYFGSAPDAAFRILTLHHHLTKIRGIGPHDIVRQARQTLSTAAEAGVHLILCGHLHVSHIETLSIGGRRIVVASAGTATSNRWREPTGPVNFYNVVEVALDGFTVEERRFVPDDGHFIPDGITRFDRSD